MKKTLELLDLNPLLVTHYPLGLLNQIFDIYD